MNYLSGELYMQVHGDVTRERERRGELRFRGEVARFLEKSEAGKPGVQSQILQGIGDLLISSGMKLKGRVEPGSPAAVCQVL